MGEMRIGIGLPAAVPGADASRLGWWAGESERAGFASVGVIDRLVYDNVEPLTALAAAAACTGRVELVTTVLNVGWRNNPVLLAKQLGSVELISGGRLTAGLGLGGWPEDFVVSHAPRPRKALWEATLRTMRDVWAGKVSGAGGPMTALPEGRPALMFGGMVPAAFRRAAAHGQGWVAPLFGLQQLREGVQAIRRAWAHAGRAGQPRIMTGRYFSLGKDPDDYIRHYYGDAYFGMVRADTLTTPGELAAELARLEEAGATDVVLYPTSPEPDQIGRLAEALPA
ncbi:LLM class flavin-dependent oxidoreductase [Nonomuraea sediminis]|uniref:LLM class flavin-dependent oxidoreductase n=1 Tax=Nonomuraea sediminis TaxID=2835864 RepID=UPI001BDC27A2|nr:LLM class flavin-dependent oxidoreductase [Nonomuraea sediminis]